MDDVLTYRLLIVVIALGIFMVVKPDWCWKLEHFLDTKGGEPSDLYLAVTRVLGTAMIVIPLVVIFISLISLILGAVGLG